MLWKKESQSPDALYIDIFASCNLDPDVAIHRLISNQNDIRLSPRKSDAIAKLKRNEGNRYYLTNQLNMAIELYNDSLRFAEPNSQQISLAYANRSICFLKLKMFEKCLIDLKLAKNAGYPKHLVHKLNGRKALCLSLIESGAQSQTVGTKLSFEADRNFPSMANVLQIRTDRNGDYTIVAKQDIAVNQTIVVEDAMFPYLVDRFGLKCNICLMGNENLMPCTRCAAAMFCPKCFGHVLHEYECGVSLWGNGIFDSTILRQVRTILSVIKMFSTVNELMTFVERLLEKPNHRPLHLTDAEAKYQVFFNGPSNKQQWTIQNVGTIDMMAFAIYTVYRTVLEMPQINALFQSQKHLRFLMHLIGHHGLLPDEIPQFKNFYGEGPIEFAREYHLMNKYFQHSCYPNVFEVLANGQLAMITARVIKKGDQLFASRIFIDIESMQERHKILLDQTGKMCFCERCKGIAMDENKRTELSNEPMYRDLSSTLLDPSDSCEKVAQSIENSMMLLRKYGHHGWCNEIKTILLMCQRLLYHRIAGCYT